MVARKAKNDCWRKFKTEDDARTFELKHIGDHFQVYEEVAARGPPDDTSYRLDAVTVCPNTGYILGWEFKRSPLYKAEFVDTLQQAIYYRLSTIADPRFRKSTANGRMLSSCSPIGAVCTMTALLLMRKRPTGCGSLHLNTE